MTSSTRSAHAIYLGFASGAEGAGRLVIQEGGTIRASFATKGGTAGGELVGGTSRAAGDDGAGKGGLIASRAGAGGGVRVKVHVGARASDFSRNALGHAGLLGEAARMGGEAKSHRA